MTGLLSSSYLPFGKQPIVSKFTDSERDDFFPDNRQQILDLAAIPHARALARVENVSVIVYSLAHDTGVRAAEGLKP